MPRPLLQSVDLIVFMLVEKPLSFCLCDILFVHVYREACHTMRPAKLVAMKVC